ncbi:phosphotransferase system, mannose-type, protein IIA [Geobacter metallireducens GS-15]|uniref:Phosphotransferase system, mannose-type, protein IIA n=1 Tax=Geobacter metallireducens (strain ATCC 53774 / DSM 7210 / GS-15) TaxID=269799 RepID=Q39W51_GEOMG|nr:PTS sugar transporter [Geobacter metallireducens]ABB31523.1 phosphotransferase system, mannose-type, protein IIA [Geobacter metallireducens GS-15]
MIGLVLVTHAGLAEELLRGAEMIVGPIESAETIGIRPGDQADAIMERIAEAVKRVSVDGALIMTDMFGGTPSNMSLSFLEADRIEVLTGVNLPMVIKFAAERDRIAVAELATSLKECGRESIAVAGDYLK